MLHSADLQQLFLNQTSKGIKDETLFLHTCQKVLSLFLLNLGEKSK